MKVCKKKKIRWLINNSKDNSIFLYQILCICIWLLLWLHYVFPFPMLMSVHPGTWGRSCINSVTIFIERYKRQTDSLREREQLFVLLIAWNKSCGSSNRRWLLCDIFPYSCEEKLFCVSCCLWRVCKAYLFLVMAFLSPQYQQPKAAGHRRHVCCLIPAGQIMQFPLLWPLTPPMHHAMLGCPR